MPKRPAPGRPLAGQVAVVAGATRGAGRGIARARGEAGATVYCTGRSVTGHPSPYGRRETIDETADMIVTAKHAARLMIEKRRGLIVEVTENNVLSAGGNPLVQTVKFALKGLAMSMASATKIDFSRHPPALLELLRAGSEVHIEWLSTISKRTKRFLNRLPPRPKVSKRKPR